MFEELMEYRRIKANESTAYRAIRLESLQSYPNSFGSSFEEQKQKKKLGFEQYIEEAHPENFIVGAFYEHQLIGLCGFYRQRAARCRHRGEIIQMYVQPNYQGNGIGLKLLDATIKEAFQIQGLEQIELGVMSNIKAACRTYEKAGFQEYGLQKNVFKTENFTCDQRFMVLFKK